MKDTTRVQHARSSSNKGPNGSPTVIIIAVLAGVLSIFAFFMLRGFLKRKKARASNRNPTIAYTGLVNDPPTESRDIETGANGASIRSTMATSLSRAHVDRRPSQNSTRTLPAYKERPPNGEIVLVERLERPSVSENYEELNNGDETESTPLTAPAATYAYNSGEVTPEIPPVALTTTNSRVGGSMSYDPAADWRGQPKNLESNGSIIVSSVNVPASGCVQTRAPLTSGPRGQVVAVSPP